MALICILGCMSVAGADGLKLPGKLTQIGDRAFFGDPGLTKVTVPDGVKEIGEEAFAYCYNLSFIAIPDSVTAIGEGAFDGCAAGFKVQCSMASFAAQWCEENNVAYEIPNLKVYINRTLLNQVGLDRPYTVDEWIAAAKTCWYAMGEYYGLACRMPDIIRAFRAIEPGYSMDLAHLMIAAGELTYFETTDPLSVDALVIVTDKTPGRDFEELVPAVPPTPAPTAVPVFGDPQAYIYQEALDQLGFAEPPADIYVYMEMAAALGMYTLAADCDESAIHAIMEADPSLTEEEANLIFASGQLDYTQSATPFARGALLVGSKTAPEAGSGYVLLSGANDTGKKAYIQQEWLDRLGLSMPRTTDELTACINAGYLYDPNGNGIMDEVGIVAKEDADYCIAWQVFDPSFNAEKVNLLMAVGDLYSWMLSDTPFDEDAMVVVTDDALPAGSGYVQLGGGSAPTPQPTGTPRPTPVPDGDVKVYIHEEAMAAILDAFDVATLDDIYIWEEVAAAVGLIPLAADNADAAMEALVEICGYNHEQAALLLAAGEINFTESSDPFNEYGLVVASAYAPTGSYVLYEVYLESVPDITPRPTATPRPTPDPNAPTPDGDVKVYVLEEAMYAVMEAFGVSTLDDIYIWEEIAAAVGLIPLASDDGNAAMEALVEICGYNHEQAALLLAAGEINFTESSDPFNEYALVVASGFAPTGIYVLYEDYLANLPDITPTPTPAGTPVPPVSDSDAVVYIYQPVLDLLGLEKPMTIYECMEIAAEVGMYCLAAEDADAAVLAIMTVDASMNAEHATLLLAAGEVSYVESDDPFNETAFLVASDTPPISDSYVRYDGQPIPEKQAYINVVWLERCGIEMVRTVDELVEVIEAIGNLDPNGNGIQDEIGMAAESMSDFVIAFQALDASFNAEKVNLMLAAGVIMSWEEVDAPFQAHALVVISDETPPSSEYVLLGN